MSGSSAIQISFFPEFNFSMVISLLHTTLRHQAPCFSFLLHFCISLAFVALNSTETSSQVPHREKGEGSSHFPTAGSLFSTQHPSHQSRYIRTRAIAHTVLPKVLPKTQDHFPSTHIGWFMPTLNSNSRRSVIPSPGPRGHLLQRHTHKETNKNKIRSIKKSRYLSALSDCVFTL